MFLLSPLFTLGYWFNPRPEPMSSLITQALMGSIIVLFVLALIFYFLAKAKMDKDRVTARILKKLNGLSSFLVVVLLFMFFFFWQRIPYLSSRFWVLAWLITALIWLFFILRYAIVYAPERRAALLQEERYKKYLPKKKR